MICHSFRSQTCCLLQFCGRTWLSGRTCAPELVASWRRGRRDRWGAQVATRFHEHCIAVHSASINQCRRGLSQFKRDLCKYIYIYNIHLYMIIYVPCVVLCFVLPICVNNMNIHNMMNQVCKLMKVGQLKISQSPNTWMSRTEKSHGIRQIGRGKSRAKPWFIRKQLGTNHSSTLLIIH